MPAQILEMLPGHNDLVSVDISGAARTINIGLLDGPPDPGTWVLVHTGFALMTITEEEAKDAMAFLDAMGQAHLDVAAGPPPVPPEVAGWTT